MKLSIEGKTRKDILDAAVSVGITGAHIAPSLSLVEISLAVLNVMKDGDRFILSKGHGALGYYAAMHQLGIISDSQFLSFEKDGGEFPGQPSRSENNHVFFSSGSLGMGLSYASGLALADTTHRNFVILGDGELDEGSNWEAAGFISKHKLNNVVVIVDNNGLQSDGTTNEALDRDIEKVWEAHGWNVVSCDGHSVDAIISLLNNISEKPEVIIAKTIKGKGISFMENNNDWHHHELTQEDYEKAISELGERYGLC